MRNASCVSSSGARFCGSSGYFKAIELRLELQSCFRILDRHSDCEQVLFRSQLPALVTIGHESLVIINKMNCRIHMCSLTKVFSNSQYPPQSNHQPADHTGKSFDLNLNFLCVKIFSVKRFRCKLKNFNLIFDLLYGSAMISTTSISRREASLAI